MRRLIFIHIYKQGLVQFWILVKITRIRLLSVNPFFLRVLRFRYFDFLWRIRLIRRFIILRVYWRWSWSWFICTWIWIARIMIWGISKGFIIWTSRNMIFQSVYFLFGLEQLHIRRSHTCAFDGSLFLIHNIKFMSVYINKQIKI